MSDVQKTVPSGVYAPLYTFFHEDEPLDLEAFKQHVKWVASAGVGIVALGSSGEAVHLSHDERREVLLAARQVLDSDASLAAIPLIAGTPASSTRETIELTRQAAECGADFAMVITPGYFAGALTRAAIKQFFTDVAEASLFLDGAGCITGLANLAPKTCMKLYKATTEYLQSPTAEALDEVRRLQGIVSRGDWPVIKGGIAGPKYVLDRIRGYGGAPRRPLLPMEAKDGEKMLAALQEILDHEKTL
ncbi:hypothetical protein C6P46_000849 [Rhodotorula mucilaginosa]|uniref:Dihydrodipicolinate synthetase n=1 Tax=Rhodotorula mucilaginosa TaxID=5537 RepID=A0A9P6VTS5_RHOMI|nr:hypothetical protein C6P46_000849 [Rhodotorula mucilaginosa]TKA50664.1 hypothetical protein B0A53_06181 [Rhodotorula sp. CCFEE 5036]